MSLQVKKLLKELGKAKPSPPTARFRNGVGAFYRPCIKLNLCYEAPKHGLGYRSSLDFSEFILQNSTKLATKYPSVEVCVVSRRGPPAVEAFYANGAKRVVDLTKMTRKQIAKEIELLSDGSGRTLTTFKTPVIPDKQAQSVVPVWNPFQAQSMFKL